MAPVPKAPDRKSRLQEFVDWAAAHITGDEKGRLHSLSLGERARVRVLDRFFQAFGQKGLLDIGGTAEFRIRIAKEDGGGTAFADYVWKTCLPDANGICAPPPSPKHPIMPPKCCGCVPLVPLK